MDFYDYLNETGSTASGWNTPGAWGGIAQGVGALAGVAGSYFSAQQQADAARAIASGDQKTKERLIELQGEAERQIQANHDKTAIEIEKIRAIYGGMNKVSGAGSGQSSDKNWIVIGTFMFLIVGTIGVFYIGTKK